MNASYRAPWGQALLFEVIGGSLTLLLQWINTVLTPLSVLVLDRVNSGFGVSVGPIACV